MLIDQLLNGVREVDRPFERVEEGSIVHVHGHRLKPSRDEATQFGLHVLLLNTAMMAAPDQGVALPQATWCVDGQQGDGISEDNHGTAAAGAQHTQVGCSDQLQYVSHSICTAGTWTCLPILSPLAGWTSTRKGDDRARQENSQC